MTKYISRRSLLLAGGSFFLLFTLCLCSLLFIMPEDEPVAISQAIETEDTIIEEESRSSSTIARPTETATIAIATSTSTPTKAAPSPSATATADNDHTLIEETAVSLLGYTPAVIETAVVLQIIDGDTIEVLINEKVERVRYIGMDTPERGEALATEATALNSQLVAGQNIYMIQDISERDRYDRLLRYVFLADGTFVNGVLVQQGVAQAVAYEPDTAAHTVLLSLQSEAQTAQIGFWIEPPTTQPTNTPTALPPTATAPPTNTAVPSTATPVPMPPTAVPVQPSATSVPPTSVPEPTQPPPAPEPQIIISSIFYDGVEPRSEGDEYAVISNTGAVPVNLGGWRLNAGDAGQDFWFPTFELAPGASCRVYTNQVHGDSCGGGSYFSGRAIWNNDGECGYLYNAEGVEVSNRCY